MEVIKKYKNRKLYSTTLSKYVTIGYILDLVKTGQRFVVVDNDTKQDITNKTVKTGLTTLEMPLETMRMIIKGV